MACDRVSELADDRLDFNGKEEKTNKYFPSQAKQTQLVKKQMLGVIGCRKWVLGYPVLFSLAVSFRTSH